MVAAAKPFGCYVALRSLSQRLQFLLLRSGSSCVLLPALFMLHCSRQKYTRCQLKLCSPAAPFRLRSSKRLLMLIHTSFRKASLRFTCVVRRLRKGYRKFTAAPTYIASIALSCFTATTFVGARGAASKHSFLMPSGGLAASKYTCNNMGKKRYKSSISTQESMKINHSFYHYSS